MPTSSKSPKEKFIAACKDFYLKLEEIDSETPYTSIVPAWWQMLDMVRRTIAAYLTGAGVSLKKEEGTKS